MAKVIKYRFLSSEVNKGTEEKPNVAQIFIDKTMGWNDANEEIAKREAYNGKYTIEDDGQEEPESVETADDILNALLGVKG